MDKFYIVLTLLLYIWPSVFADVLVYSDATHQLDEEFLDLPARFGTPITSAGIRFYLVKGQPINGCDGPLNAPPEPNATTKWGVLIQRGGENCTFEKKVRNAESCGYDVVIVYNNNSNDLETMSAENDVGIGISAAFVGETTGKLLHGFLYGSTYFIVLNDELPFNINTRLILPFSIVVGLVFLIIIGFMVVRCVREQRRLQRRRLPRSVLKTIPIIKFTKALPYETCVICLDDYVEGEKLRKLPCAHVYHSKCIDPWLTKTRRVCPICKRKVLSRRRPRPVERHSSDYSTSDTDADDRTPLINPVENNSTSHGTFNATTTTAAAAAIFNDDDNGNGSDNRISRTRENPFNRPVINESIVNSSVPIMTDEVSPFWNRFIRPTANAMQVNNAPSHSAAVAVNHTDTAAILIDVPSNASNNILNVNLSGSFRGERDRDDRQPITAAAAAAGGSGRGAGVAAIPNTEFMAAAGAAAAATIIGGNDNGRHGAASTRRCHNNFNNEDRFV